MPLWGWICCGVMGAVVLISYVQHRAASRTYRPLTSRQPARRVTADVPLGMEATDIAAVNRVTRHNEALERSHTNWTRGSRTQAAAADTDIQPLADDETYARRFHTAFMKNKD